MHDVVRQSLAIPDDFIVFISGVPGVGKTTVSYELFKKFNNFRIIEETDLIREVLRGYNDYLKIKFGDQVNFIFKKIQITDHTKLLTYAEAKIQCKTMEKSFEKIVARQQRRRIPSIINGVHIIPELLNGLAENNNIIYINLYVTKEEVLYNRILNRDPTSYMLNHIPFIFQTNKDLFFNTAQSSLKYPHIFNVDVTDLDVDSTIKKIVLCINKRIQL